MTEITASTSQPEKSRTSYFTALVLLAVLTLFTLLYFFMFRNLHTVTLIASSDVTLYVNDYTLGPYRQATDSEPVEKATYTIRLPLGPNEVRVASKDGKVITYKIKVSEEEENPIFLLIGNDFKEHSRRRAFSQ